MVTIEKLAATVSEATIYGDSTHKVARIVDFTALDSEHDMVVLTNEKLVNRLTQLRAPKACAIVERSLWKKAEDSLSRVLKAAIISPRPRFALARVSTQLPRCPAPTAGTHPSANVDPTAELGEGCVIGAGAFIANDVRIGAHSVVHPNAMIGAGSTLGEFCRIDPGVVIADGVTIGDRVIIQSNAVIGGDGFSFETERLNAAEQAKMGESATADSSQPWSRIESFGSVEIGDDVEIGAGTTIDRAAFGQTTIGRGTKVDNLVQIGHNCRIGENTLLCSQVGIAGSSIVGNGCILAGKVGVADHLVIEDNSVVMAKSGVTKNLKGGMVYYGMPARPVKDTLRNYSLINKLGDIRLRLANLEKALDSANLR